MDRILVIGAGKIGTLITALLSSSGDYQVVLADLDFKGADITRFLEKQTVNTVETIKCDITDSQQFDTLLKNYPVDAIVSSLPFYVNPQVAQYAKKYNLHYFDLTEDTTVTEIVKELARDAEKAFVPQCGLAPGFISIVANSLMNRFEKIETVKLRVGALPQQSSHSLKYALTWSTDGLINQYANPCHAIEDGITTTLQPLEGLEEIEMDGTIYEAFNTSGGLGSLAQLHSGNVKTMNYKTIRYPGHCEKIRFLMIDLGLENDRTTLKHIFENAIPQTQQDVVLIYVSVTGYRQGLLQEESFTKKLYPKEIGGSTWTAIQVTTASGLCGVLDLVLKNAYQYHGLIHQEKFSLDDFLKNRFGRHFA